MFNEKTMGNLVLANTILSVAVLLMSIAVFARVFVPAGPAIAGGDNERGAAAERPAPKRAANNDSEKLSKKYDNGMTLDKALTKGKPVAVLFYADWCGFCKRFTPTFAALSKDKELKKKYVFAYVNSENPEARKLMQQYNVTGFPTLYLINPKTVDKAHVSNALMFQGDAEATLKDQFLKFIDEGSSAVTQPAPRKAEADEE